MQSVPFDQVNESPSAQLPGDDDLSSLSYQQRNRINASQVLLSAGFFSAVMHVLMVQLVGWVLWDANSPVEVIPWLMTLSSLVIFQIFLLVRHGGSRFRIDTSERALSLFSLSMLGVGLCWGYAGWFLFPVGDPARQIFLTFVLGGMAMTAVSVQHAHRPTCLASLIPGMMPLSLRYLVEPGELNLIYGGLLFVYTLVLVSMMQRHWKFSEMAFGLQLENERLLAEAADQAVELDIARQQAVDANIAKSRFLAQASHDLRQPLHAISLYIEALPVPKSDKKANRIVGRVRQSLDVLSRLFNSLLDVTLLDTGQIEVRPVVFRARDLIEQVRNEFSNIAAVAQVDLRIHAPDIAVRTDPVLLRRMLQNLCSNALRHAEGGGILLAVRRRKGHVAIEVYDTGPGIPKKDQARIFEEFTRLDTVRMGGSAAPGLGLGLAIVRRIADVLGLSLELSSREDKGTKFCISGIEVRSIDEAVSLQEETTEASEDILAGVKVLLIDDDRDTLEAASELLSKWGCTIETMLGWTGAPRQVPDILICDYELDPEFSGFDAREKLVAATGKEIPTIMISGNSTPELRNEAQQKNLPLIHKPVRPGQLRSALLHVMTDLRQAEG